MDDLALIDEIARRAEEHQKQREKEFAIPELEKIKAEIKQQGSIHVKYRRTEDIDHLVDSIVYQCKDSFCNYIDNSIKELKGENNIEEKEESDVLSNS